jgi:hypothetical protein
MTIRARTTRTENDLVDFANENNIPLASLDHTVNSSGMFTVFHKDATQARGSVIFGTDDSTGAAPGTAYNAEVTTAVNVANCSKVALFITVVTGNANTLKIFSRLSRLSAPTPATATDWHRPITAAGAFSETVVGATEMTTAGNRILVEVDVAAANWATFSFVGNGAHRITIYAEAVA